MDTRIQLIHDDTGRVVNIGDKVTIGYPGDNRTGILKAISPPHKISSSGRVHVQEHGNNWEDVFFPSVIGCTICVDGVPIMGNDAYFETMERKAQNDPMNRHPKGRWS